jgi:hypothetical protein
VGLWAMPGWARKAKEEKPKPIDGEIAGLLVAIEVVEGWCDRKWDLFKLNHLRQA